MTSKKQKIILKPSGPKLKKKRGRPVNWIKNPPEYLKGLLPDPEFLAGIKKSEDEWREMCRNGYSSDYFELCDITDPELMGVDALDWDAAIKIPKYKAAIKRIQDAKKRNAKQLQSVSAIGAHNSQLNAQSRREQLKHYLHSEFYTTEEHYGLSIRQWADSILIKEAAKPESKRWDGGRVSKPGLTHLRGILKQIKDGNP